MTQETSSPLATLAKYSLIGGAVVAGVSFLGAPAGEALSKVGGEGFWADAAHKVGSWLTSASSGIGDVGDKIGGAIGLDKMELTKKLDGRLIASIAAAIGTGGMAALVQSFSGSEPAPAQLPNGYPIQPQQR